MKDIFKKPAKPLDLSEADSQVYSRYTLDLSPKAKDKKLAPRQTNFYEYMPAVMQSSQAMGDQDDQRPHADDEFGDKLQYWYDTSLAAVKGFYTRTVLQVSSALKPLRLYWAVVIGVGLILGLLIIAYIATHRNWITSFPSGTQVKPAVSAQGDKSHSPTSSPGKGGAGGLAVPTPAAAAQPSSAGGTATGAAAGGTVAGSGAGSSLPAAGSLAPAGSTGGSSSVTAPVSGGTTTQVIQAAPAPTPAPVTAPLPVSAPAPTPAPLLPSSPVDSVLSPVKSLL